MFSVWPGFATRLFFSWTNRGILTCERLSTDDSLPPTSPVPRVQSGQSIRSSDPCFPSLPTNLQLSACNPYWVRVRFVWSVVGPCRCGSQSPCMSIRLFLPLMRTPYSVYHTLLLSFLLATLYLTFVSPSSHHIDGCAAKSTGRLDDLMTFERAALGSSPSPNISR